MVFLTVFSSLALFTTRRSSVCIPILGRKRSFSARSHAFCKRVLDTNHPFLRITKTGLVNTQNCVFQSDTLSVRIFPMKLLAILLVALLLHPPTIGAQDFSNPVRFSLAQSEERQVWVNTATGIYQYPGTRWYGNTKQGKFMSEKDAIAQGYRAARNGQ